MRKGREGSRGEDRGGVGKERDGRPQDFELATGLLAKVTARRWQSNRRALDCKFDVLLMASPRHLLAQVYIKTQTASEFQ